MTIPYLEVLAGIAMALSILMAGAWLVQQRTGNSGWVDTIWTFFPRPGGRRSCAVAGRRNFPQRAAMAGGGAGGDLVAAARVHIAIRTAGIAADPRYAAFAREWGVDSPRRVIKKGVVT